MVRAEMCKFKESQLNQNTEILKRYFKISSFGFDGWGVGVVSPNIATLCCDDFLIDGTAKDW
jgi:hypothetical protein